jgi:predicted dehydrogenase
MGEPIGWGLIGGGLGSQIGEAHRIAARLDGLYRLSAGALDIDPQRGQALAQDLGITPERTYDTWQDMLEGERGRDDRVQIVTVATPNATHFQIAKGFLEAGVHVLCEKPLTMTVAEAEEIGRVAGISGRLCAVNYGYSGYAMVRQARAMVARGDLGRVRVAVAEFAHGAHSDAADADNPRVRWRYDPAQAGVSSVLADCGSHALHMISYVIGQTLTSLSADFVSSVEGRRLEDDAQLALRYDGGAVGRLWTSAVAAGQVQGFTLRVFGEKGGLGWGQEHPNQLSWTPLGEPTRTLERGADYLTPEAQRASRITAGHAEGLFGAFGNIYRDLAEVIRAETNQSAVDPLALTYPTVEQGIEGVRAIHAAARSAGQNGAWIEL